MIYNYTRVLLCGVVMTVAVSSASADEIRVGAMSHDVTLNFINEDRQKLEDGLVLSLEYIWDQPQWLGWAGNARPYVYGALNLAGDTNHGGAGLNFQKDFAGRFYGEYEVGLSIHDGTTKIEIIGDEEFTALSFPERRAYIDNFFARRENEIEFGSPVLIRNQFALGYRFNETWSADISWEHLSHGRLFDDDRNDGLDNFGLRVSRKFD